MSQRVSASRKSSSDLDKTCFVAPENMQREMNFWVITQETLLPEKVIAAARILALDMDDLQAVQNSIVVSY